MRTIRHVPVKLAKARQTAVAITEVVNKWLATINTVRVKPMTIVYLRYPKIVLKYTSGFNEK